MRDFLENIINACFRHWIWFFAVLGLGGVAAGTYYFTTQGPHNVVAGGNGILHPNDPTAVKLAQEVDALYAQFQAGTDKAGRADANALAALVQATEKQRALFRMLVGPARSESNRLAMLETELVNQRTRETIATVIRLETEGRLALDGGKMDEAGPKLAEALRLQRGINQSRADDEFKDSKMEITLRLENDTVDADSIHRAYLAARAKASQPDQKPEDAIAAYQKARDLLVRINSEYPTTAFIDPLAVKDIDIALDSLKSDSLEADSVAAEKAGDQALAQGKTAESTAAFLKARDLQVEINQKLKLSHSVSEDRAQALDVKWQSSASIPTSDRVAGMDREIADLLRQRQTGEAGPKILEAATQMERLATVFPNSQTLDQGLRSRLAYLNAHRGDLGAIQTEVYGHLLPVPGMPGRWLWKSEVTQSLYAKVARANPSRNHGTDFPVESVSWNDAQTFCTQLSWVLARPARLPEEAEFRAALGADGQPATWNLDISHGTTLAVDGLAANAAGFCGLLGNVAEWLAGLPTAADAPVAGGSYLDTPAALRAVPIESRPKDDRARQIGFRFAVDLPPGETLPATH